ncbi:hypothetical protein [Methylorubrum thiocyanatum]|uniref:hypothetical protein n=1 Tax=Methylorubrum thiocyanatum TaxID=47958 RepID=UPI0035C80726
MSTKEALIVWTLKPSVGYVVHVETWDERGHDHSGHTRPMSAERTSAYVASERAALERRGYDVEVTDREARAA